MRTVVGYVNPYLNGMASASPTGSQEPVTGAPIGTGLEVGQILSVGDGLANKWSKPGGKTLWAGDYNWVVLDPAVTGTVPVGSALYWLQTATTVPTVTTVVSGNYPDFAGVSIDPNFGAALPYAWIQNDGKCSILLSGSSSAAIYGSPVNLTAAAATFDAGAAITTVVLVNNYVGRALAAIAAGAVGYARIAQNVTRY